MTPIRRYAATARRLWFVPVACVVVGVAAALGLSLSQSTTSSASTQVLVTPGNGISIADAQLVARSDAFDRRAGAELHLGYRELQRDTTVSNPAGTTALQFSVVASSPGDATRDANAVASAFVTYYAAFIQSNGLGNGAPVVRTISPALGATTASSSRAKTVAIGLVGGLIVGVFLLGLVESRDRTMRIPEEVEDVLGARPVVVPDDPEGGQDAITRVADMVTGAAGDAPISVLVMTAGASDRPAIETAHRLAAELAPTGGRPLVRKLGQPKRRGQRNGAVTLYTANGAEASLRGIGATPIGLWVVVVQLGQTTAADIDQARLLLNDHQRSPAVWMTVTRWAVVPTQRRFRPTRPA